MSRKTLPLRVVVVRVEPANGQEPFGALELALDKTVFPAAVGLQSQTGRPTVAAWCESDVAFGSERSAEPPGSDQSMESDAATSSRRACGSRPTAHAAPPGAK